MLLQGCQGLMTLLYLFLVLPLSSSGFASAQERHHAQFLKLVEIFQHCQITYIHYQYKSRKLSEPSENFLTRVRSHFPDLNVHFRCTRFPEVNPAPYLNYGDPKTPLVPRITVPHGPRRYSQCNVKLLPTPDIEMREWVSAESGKDEPHPDFIWFLGKQKSLPFHLMEMQHLLHLQRTSILMQILDFEDVLFICLPCSALILSGSQGHVLVRKRFATFEEVTKFGIGVSRNMYRGGVHFSVFQMTEEQMKNFINPRYNEPCSLYSQNMVHADVCIGLILQRKLNFTLNFNFYEKLSPTVIYPFSAVLKATLVFHKYRGSTFTPFMATVSPYHFIVVYDTESAETHLRGILLPLGLLEAVFVLATSFLVAAIFTFSSLTTDSSIQIIMSQLSRWLSLGGFVVGQAPASTSFYRRNSNKVLWAGWSLFCVVFSMGYRGSMFSSLHIKTHSTIPTRLEDLLEKDILLGTRTTYTNMYTNQQLSVLLGAIIPEILELDHDNELMVNLMKKMKWFVFSSSMFISLMSKYSVIFGDGDEVFKVPKVFGLLDTKFEIEQLKTYVQIYSSKQVTDPKPLSILTDRIFWSFASNYMYPVLVDHVAHLSDSGIYTRFKDYIMYAAKLQGMHQMFALMFPNATAEDDLKTFESGGPKIPMRAVGAFLRNEEFFVRRYKRKKQPFSRIPGKVLRKIALYFSVIIPVSILIFLVELATKTRRPNLNGMLEAT